ncbi:hypothetical protein BJV78DRAFT_768384 [Lactifluus subvellereus]|nr:hypothetical protein BJV78DRAFT_768384 [Lactifluus subvellereus]
MEMNYKESSIIRRHAQLAWGFKLLHGTQQIAAIIRQGSSALRRRQVLVPSFQCIAGDTFSLPNLQRSLWCWTSRNFSESNSGSCEKRAAVVDAQIRFGRAGAQRWTRRVKGLRSLRSKKDRGIQDHSRLGMVLMRPLNTSSFTDGECAVTFS